MTRRLWAAGLLLGLAAGAAAAPLPLLINFQGKLTNPATNAPKNGSQSVVFNIYNAATGGTVLWGPESQTVNAVNGVFSAELGSMLALSPSVFAGGTTYLGITVGSDSEMTPRQLLVMSPYAYASAQLIGASDIRVNAGMAYSTFTATGNLLVPYGVDAATGAFSGNVTATSGTFRGTGSSQYSLEVSSGISVDAGTLRISSGGAQVQYGMAAATGSFTGTGASVYSLTTSSGIDVQNGTLMIEANADSIGTAPEVVSITTVPAATTIGTVATLIGGSQLDINPTSAVKAIALRGEVTVNAATINTPYTITLTIQRGTPGTCGTGSTTIETLPALTIYVPNKNLDLNVPFFWVDAPGTASPLEYCLAATASTANKLSIGYVQFDASEAHP